MLNLVRNPEDGFSRNAARMVSTFFTLLHIATTKQIEINDHKNCLLNVVSHARRNILCKTFSCVVVVALVPDSIARKVQQTLIVRCIMSQVMI